jgi:hypothetical protein
MNILEFTKKFYVISTMTDDFINNLAPRIAGNVAVRHFKDNSQNQGFEWQKWQEVLLIICKDTKLEAIHNWNYSQQLVDHVVNHLQRYKIESNPQSTRSLPMTTRAVMKY